MMPVTGRPTCKTEAEATGALIDQMLAVIDAHAQMMKDEQERARKRAALIAAMSEEDRSILGLWE